MKITKIVPHFSDLNSSEVALRTEPRLTEDVFNYAIRNFVPEDRRHFFSLGQDGTIVVTIRLGLTKEDIEQLAGILTNAENAIGDQKRADENRRKAFFKTLSQQTGLGL